MEKNQRGTDGKEIALEARVVEEGRLFSPSVARNRDVIRDSFISLMPDQGTIVEIGSGTGEHAVHLASQLPNVKWWPGDPDPSSHASIKAWIEHSQLDNILSPHLINVTEPVWPDIKEQSLSGIMSANMIHIASFAAAEGLFHGAGAYIATGGKLFLYGPFSRRGTHISPSNAEFDVSLKSRDPSWGVRDLENDIMPLAERNALKIDKIIEMPSNNFSVTFQRK